jgi:uncharacterized SAM-binding protein YcdF (DUF218 family)
MLFTILLVVSGAGAYFSATRCKGRGTLLLWAGIAGLFLVSWRPFACVVMFPLQHSYSPRAFPDREADAIVVLAAGMEQIAPGVPTPRLGRGTYGRSEYAAYLYNFWRPLPVLVSGGPVEANQPPAADAMGKALEREGVPASMIWYEEQSLSTHENAVYAAEILRKRGVRTIVLVTDGHHMLRAEKCFRKQGLAVVPAPSTLRTFRTFEAKQLLPGWEAISWNEDAVHEMGGLLWYWTRGWI